MIFSYHAEEMIGSSGGIVWVQKTGTVANRKLKGKLPTGCSRGFWKLLNGRSDSAF